jgi:type II restriction enzyme
VSGGVPERKAWIEDSGHFRVGNLALMTAGERDKTITEMLGDD